MEKRALSPVRQGFLNAVLTWALWIGLSISIGLAIRVSIHRAYAVDEFAYAHAGWLVSEGLVPSLDFFETKFHLPLWIFSSVFLVGGDDPHMILWLRLLIWVFVATTLAGACLANHNVRPLVVPATALVLSTNPVFMNSALEIRPDIVALTFLMAALSCLRAGRPGPVWGTALGVLFGLCLWATAKAAIYAAPVAVFWLIDASRASPDRRRLFLSPWSTLAGGTMVLALVAIYLVSTGAFEAFVEQAILHNAQFLVGERWRSAQDDLLFLALHAPWVHALAIFGLALSVARSATRTESERWYDGLLVLLSISSLASHGLQLYPFLYSLVPFMAIEGIFAGRGLAWLLQKATETSSEEPVQGVRSGFVWTRRVVPVCLVGLALAGTIRGGLLMVSLGVETNQQQRALLDGIAELTRASDPVYDNSASYVARPNAYFMPWTDLPIRRLWAEKLIAEVPVAIEESDCVVAIVDDRIHTLPEPLKVYLREHFKPYRGTILLWGQDYQVSDGRANGRFRANREGHYRVFPEEIAIEGGLTIDGMPMHSSVVHLAEGDHAVVYQGQRNVFRVQWEPQETSPAAR